MIAALEQDRLKAALVGMVRGAYAEFPYAGMHRARLVKQRGPTRVDVKPVDQRIPVMANVPLKVGAPGIEVMIPIGHDVMVGWEDAQPDCPYVTLWNPGGAGAVPSRFSILGQLVELGAVGADQQVYRGSDHSKIISSLMLSLQAAAQALAAASTDVRAPLRPGFELMRFAIEQHRNSLENNDHYLSKVVKVI